MDAVQRRDEPLKNLTLELIKGAPKHHFAPHSFPMAAYPLYKPLELEIFEDPVKGPGAHLNLMVLSDQVPDMFLRGKTVGFFMGSSNT